MLNIKRNIKLIIMLVATAGTMLIMNTNSYANEYSMNLAGTTDLIGVKNDISSLVRPNAPVYFEDLSRTKGLFCNAHGVALPSRLSNKQPLKDATLNTSGINVEIDQLRENNKIQRNPAYDYMKNVPDAKNPYGTTGSVVTTTRTQALYNNDGLRKLSYKEAYVLSHEKDNTKYPDPVQLALWGVTNYVAGGSLSNENVSISTTEREIAKNLVNEAIKYEETMLELDEFKAKNNGKTLVDKTDYNEVHPGYNKKTGKIIVGPFVWDYVRGYIKPSELGQSKNVNKDGVVSFSGISGIKWYADDAKTLEIKNVTLVYGERNLGAGDEKYAYPYPNEPFYIEFSKAENPEVKFVSKATIDLDIMQANGEAYDLNGSYNDVNWVAKDDPIKCTNTSGVCVHGIKNHKIQHKSYSFWGGFTVYYTDCPGVYCSDHPTKKIGDGHIKGHDFYIEGVIVKQNVVSQRTEAVPYAKIVMNNNVADMELGSPFMYFLPLPIVVGHEREEECEIVPELPGDPVDPNTPPNVPEQEVEEIENPGIPLIFEIAGEVWIDNPTGKETIANGTRDAGELGKPNVEVYLYNAEKDGKPVAQTITNMNGKYSFGYVEIGEEYYVEFVYDGMTYKTTKYLNSEFTESLIGELGIYNDAYIKNPDNYVNSSHAVENTLERDAFNSKFYEISNNMATGVTGLKTKLTYHNVVSSQGTMASLITTDSAYMTLPEFKMSARTSNTGLLLPLNDAYYVDNENLNLPNQNGQEYKYIRTYEGLKHINLGLIKREQGDFAVKNDTYQTTITMKGNSQSFEHNAKTTNGLTYDANVRTAAYYTNKQYTQLLNKEDYAWRYDSSYGEDSILSKEIYDESDELNVYVEYKFLIRNQSTLEWGKIKELTNYFDKDLKYGEEYYHTDMTSWIEVKMNGSKEATKKEIFWKYGKDKNGYKSIYTEDLKDIKLKSGETLELHLILQVSKDKARNIILNNDDNPKYENILEITKFSVNEGLVDRDSNPGSANLKDTKTFEDDTDNAPFVKIKLDESEEAKLGNIIRGNVFEDLKTKDSVLVNNMFTGNGIKDSNEKGIANVKVELIEVLMDKDNNKEIELIIKEAVRTDKNGNYKFTNLPTGTYKVKFTYGDEYQLKKDVTYNGQDYKSVSTDTLKQQYEKNPMEVMILIDTSEGMNYNNRLDTIKNASKQLISSIYSKVQTAEVGLAFFSEPKSDDKKINHTGLISKPDVDNLINALDKEYKDYGGNLADTIENAMKKFSNNSSVPKVMIILTDGYMEDVNDDKEMIEKAMEKGIKVVSVLSSMDEWSENVFGNEYEPKVDALYSVSDSYLTQYITEVALEEILFEFEKTLPNLTDAKDVQIEYVVSAQSKVGDIHTRKQNIEYTDIMVNENGQIVDGKDSSDLSAFAKNTQMTAITPVRVVTLDHENTRTENTNLSLIERPKVELQIKESVVGFSITLADGTVLIDTEKHLTQNVLELEDKKIIHMDDELIQGATLRVKYKITVVNNGQVDTLGEYFDYDMFNKAEVAKYTATVPTVIGTIFNYFDNLVFRTEENSRMPIEVNKVILDNMKFTNGRLTNPEMLIEEGKVFNPDHIEIVNESDEDGKTKLLKTTLAWEQKNNIGTAADDVDDKLKKGLLQVVSTNTLKDLELYPTLSKEVLSDNHIASVSTYIQFSKVLSANDSSDTLSYNNAVEIVERLNALGRRDYIGVPGNYLSFEEITEYDSAKAENVAILNPFGTTDQSFYALIAGCVFILGAGVVFIKRKVL